MTKSQWILIVLLLPLSLWSQDAPPMEEEDDDSVVDFSNLVQTAENKAFCSSRVIGQLPLKLVSFGYDYQTAHTLQPAPFVPGGASTENEINRVQDARLAINYPVLSKNSFLLNLGD